VQGVGQAGLTWLKRTLNPVTPRFPLDNSFFHCSELLETKFLIKAQKLSTAMNNYQLTYISTETLLNKLTYPNPIRKM